MDRPIASLKNRAWREVAAIDAALERGDIDEAGWFESLRRLVTPAYLVGGNPRAESGSSRDAAGWEAARRLVLDAFDGDAELLDVGCANGHLMESLHAWAAEDGRRVEPYGVDIAPELAELARRRLPRWRDRIWIGNALHWEPPMRFDVIRTGLEYVPARRRGNLVRHLLRFTGRLLLGPVSEEPAVRETEDELRAIGVRIGGVIERPHTDPRIVRRVVWVDAEV